MTELTKEKRQDIYIAVANLSIKATFTTRFFCFEAKKFIPRGFECARPWSGYFEDKEVVKIFPEFGKFKPKRLATDGGWFATEEHRATALLFAAEMCN